MTAAARIRAGDLRHRLRINQLVRGDKNEVGQRATELQEIAVIHGEVLPLSGTELFNARQSMPQTTHSIQVRDGITLDATMQVVEVKSGRVFEILEPPRSIEGRDEKLVFLAKEEP